MDVEETYDGKYGGKKKEALCYKLTKLFWLIIMSLVSSLGLHQYLKPADY